MTDNLLQRLQSVYSTLPPGWSMDISMADHERRSARTHHTSSKIIALAARSIPRRLQVRHLEVQGIRQHYEFVSDVSGRLQSSNTFTHVAQWTRPMLGDSLSLSTGFERIAGHRGV